MGLCTKGTEEYARVACCMCVCLLTEDLRVCVCGRSRMQVCEQRVALSAPPLQVPQKSDPRAYLLWERASPGSILRLHNSSAKTSERVDSCVTATANAPW